MVAYKDSAFFTHDFVAEIEDISARISFVLGRSVYLSVAMDPVLLHISVEIQLGMGGECLCVCVCVCTYKSPSTSPSCCEYNTLTTRVMRLSISVPTTPHAGYFGV